MLCVRLRGATEPTRITMGSTTNRVRLRSKNREPHTTKRVRNGRAMVTPPRGNPMLARASSPQTCGCALQQRRSYAQFQDQTGVHSPTAPALLQYRWLWAGQAKNSQGKFHADRHRLVPLDSPPFCGKIADLTGPDQALSQVIEKTTDRHTRMRTI